MILSLLIVLVGIAIIVAMPISLTLDKVWKKPHLLTYSFFLVFVLHFLLFFNNFYPYYPELLFDVVNIFILLFGMVILIIEFKRNLPVMLIATFLTFLMGLFIAMIRFIAMM